jgi:hypothetical protein
VLQKREKQVGFHIQNGSTSHEMPLYPGKTGTSYYFPSSASVSNLVKDNYLDNSGPDGFVQAHGKTTHLVGMRVRNPEEINRKALERLQDVFEGEGTWDTSNQGRMFLEHFD